MAINDELEDLVDPIPGDGYFWRGELVMLRQGRAADVPHKIQQYYDSEARSLLQYGVTDFPPISEEAYSKLYLGDEKTSDDNIYERISFAIDSLAGEYVGWVGMYGREPRHGRFNFGGISIFREHRRKGYALDALGIVLRYGFYELRMQKCDSGSRSDNIASQRLHERAGFVREGVQRRHTYTNNRYYDQIHYGILKEEFEETPLGRYGK